jgi:DNA-directed RNA polymerase specialized sigma24 family protein
MIIMYSSDTAASGTDELLIEAFEAHGAFVFSRALAITRNFHDAEDVAQEVWMRIVRIVRNTALNASRRRIAHPEVQFEGSEAATDSGLAHPADRLDRTVEFDAATAAMNDRERRAFLLWHCEGCSFCQIGRVLGTSAKNARLIVWRATRKFRAHLKGKTRE